MAGSALAELFVPGVPAPKYGDRPKSLTALGAHAWKAALETAISRVSPPPMSVVGGAIGVEMVFWMPRPVSIPRRRRERPEVMPDIDKLVRMVLDAASGLVYDDDGQVVDLDVRLFYADPPYVPGMALRFFAVKADDPAFRMPVWCAATLRLQQLDALPEVGAWS